MVSKVKIGICGGGAIIETHMDAISRVDDVEAVALSSRTMKTAKKTARRFKISKAFDDHRRVVEHSDVDLVLIATPNYQHCELALRAIDAGKHVMVEKPLAMNVREGKKMVSAAKKAGVHLIYAEQLPFAPKFVQLAEMAQSGGLGDLYMVRQIERHAGPYSPWFFKKETAGGGALMDLGCHSISVIREIMGKAEPKKVKAVARTFAHTHGDVEDFIIVQMEYESGALGIAESNWCHLGGMDCRTELFGSKGNAYADISKGSGLEVYSEKGMKFQGDKLVGWEKPKFDNAYENGYIAQIEAMRESVLRDAPPIQSGEDGLAILRIMASAYKAASVSSLSSAAR